MYLHERQRGRTGSPRDGAAPAVGGERLPVAVDTGDRAKQPDRVRHAGQHVVDGAYITSILSTMPATTPRSWVMARWPSWCGP